MSRKHSGKKHAQDAWGITSNNLMNCGPRPSPVHVTIRSIDEDTREKNNHFGGNEDKVHKSLRVTHAVRILILITSNVQAVTVKLLCIKEAMAFWVLTCIASPPISEKKSKAPFVSGRFVTGVLIETCTISGNFICITMHHE